MEEYKNNSSSKDILKKLNLNRLKNSSIQNFDQTVKEMSPHKLISNKRFDIVAKYIYAKFYEENYKSKWGLKLYKNHLWAFNRYEEDDRSGKVGINKFINSFHKTLTSVREEGFNDNISILPVSSKGVPLDGAHRISAAIYHNKEVKVVNIGGHDPNYNYEFFKSKGLLNCWSDAIAYEFCKINKNIRIIIQGEEINEFILRKLKEYDCIYYEKTIQLTKNGVRNLVELLKLPDHNIKLKDGLLEIKIIFFDSTHWSNIFNNAQILKEEHIIGDELSYISQSEEESFKLAQILLNDNSISFINFTNKKQVKEMKHIINLLRGESNYNESEGEDICVISNSVIQIYGLVNRRNNVDIINFHTKNNTKNKEINFYEKKKDDIIYNPKNHFYFDGVKFSTLDVVGEMKLKSMKFEDYLAIKKLSGWIPKVNFKVLRYEIFKILEICKLMIIRYKLSLIKVKRGLHE
ncbi:hypothetical protein [Rossellomorea sp. NRS-1567]|uniref:hypothetical protein n=1 Tax=Rossellomorea sp. NRS-1567 TaxID=3233901 RepID=UPI003D27EA08